MRILLVFLVFLFFAFFFSCGGLEETSDPERRRDEPEGDPDPPKVELPDFTNWKEFFKNCKPEYDTPDNFMDMIVGVIPGLKEAYPPGLIRSCFEKKSQEAHEQICNARDHWERIRKNPKSPAQKSRAESELVKLERLEYKLNERMHKFAERARTSIAIFEDRNPKTRLSKFTNWWRQDETEGWENIWDVQSYSSCTVYTDDSDDD